MPHAVWMDLNISVNWWNMWIFCQTGATVATAMPGLDPMNAGRWGSHTRYRTPSTGATDGGRVPPSPMAESSTMLLSPWILVWWVIYTKNNHFTGCNVGWCQWTIFSYFWDYYFLLCCCYMWPSLVHDVETIFHLSYVQTASGNLFWNMSDAHETANCSFTGITHISEKIFRCC